MSLLAAFSATYARDESERLLKQAKDRSCSVCGKILGTDCVAFSDGTLVPALDKIVGAYLTRQACLHASHKEGT